MSNLFRYFGKVLLVTGMGLMLLAGSSSLLYADIHPNPGQGLAGLCPGCSPCSAVSGATDCRLALQCQTEANAGDCTVGMVSCGCSKGTGDVCGCRND